MNTRQVAGYLGINEKKIYAFAKAGKIPCTRVTGKWTFLRKLIDAWIEQSAVRPERGEMRPEPRPASARREATIQACRFCASYLSNGQSPPPFSRIPSAAARGLRALRNGVADLRLPIFWMPKAVNTTCPS